MLIYPVFRIHNVNVSEKVYFVQSKFPHLHFGSNRNLPDFPAYGHVFSTWMGSWTL